VLATPATRRLARELGVNLAEVPATGPNGRVTKEDLQNYAKALSTGQEVKSTQGTYITSGSSIKTNNQNRVTLIPFRGIRKKISEAMVRSRTTIPDFAYVDECEISELVEFRKEVKSIAEKQGIKLTYMPFIIKAVIKGLKQFPYMNAELDEANGNIIVKNYYNIGVAVDTENGLVVPNIKNADQKTILELAKEVQVLSEKARQGKLTLDELKDGTFTITNAGNIGGMLATPIINYPETAIFGVHKISRRPVVKVIDGEEKIVPADVIWLSTSVDHRVVDGADAARFMNVVMDYLSNPKKLLLDSI
jgi:pyruvate dehydrogenase E2 component (dihydrolipoamide acetyltransferase)